MWLFQKQIWTENRYSDFYEECVSLGIEIEQTNIIPFTNHLSPEPSREPTLFFGSVRFYNIAKNRNWKTLPNPGVEIFKQAPELFFNGDGWESTFGNVDFRGESEVFVKPYRDKFFTGTVIPNQQFLLEKVQTGSSSDPEKELVWVSPAVNILKEVRCYVIGGEVIAGSFYKCRGNVQQSEAPDYILSEAKTILKELVSKINFDEISFSLDIGIDSSGKWKIVELNNLNSAGIYHCNFGALARAYYNYYGK